MRNRLLAWASSSHSMRLVGRWRTDRSGVTAMEFAIVAIPFLLLLYGIIGVGLYFFTTFTLENAVEQASRLIRTGQAQTSNMTAAAFKAEVCSRTPGFVDCTGQLRVNVQSYSEFNQITAATTPKCLDSGGNLNAVSTYQTGGASEVVLVWVCLEWTFAQKIPFIKLGDMGNGSSLIQTATVFRAEPYAN